MEDSGTRPRFETPQERQAEAVRLREAGWSLRRIAQRLDVGKTAVERYLAGARSGRSISKVADEQRPRVGRLRDGPGGGTALTEDWHRRRRDAGPATQVFDALSRITEASKVLEAHWHGADSIEGQRRAHLTLNIDRIGRALKALDDVVTTLDEAGFGSGPTGRKVTQDRMIDWESGEVLPVNKRVHRRNEDEREEFRQEREAERTRAQEEAHLTRVVLDDLPGAREATQRLREESGKSGRWLGVG